MSTHQPRRVLVTGAADRSGEAALADLAARDVPRPLGFAAEHEFTGAL